MANYIGPIGAQDGEVIDLSPEVADRINLILNDADARNAERRAAEEKEDSEYMAALAEAKATGKMREFIAEWFGSSKEERA